MISDSANADARSVVIICTPMRSTASAEYLWSLENAVEFVNVRLAEVGKAVDEARNLLAQRAREIARNTKARDAAGNAVDLQFFVAWIDDDAAWEPGTLSDLVHLLREHPWRPDVVSACWADRKPFSMHSAFREFQWHDAQPALVRTRKGFGLHFAIHRADLLDRLGHAPFTCLPGKSEDFSFCRRVAAAGGVLAMSSRNFVAHVDVATGEAYLPGCRPGRIVEGRFEITPDPRNNAEIIAAYRGNTRLHRDYGPHVTPIAHGAA